MFIGGNNASYNKWPKASVAAREEAMCHLVEMKQRKKGQATCCLQGESYLSAEPP